MIEKLISYEENPTLYEVLAAFTLLRGYVEFRYRKLPECKKKLTPSAAAAQASTKMPEDKKDWNLCKGFLGDDSVFASKDMNFLLRFRNNQRKVIGDVVDEKTGEIIEESYFSDKSNAQEDGSRKIGFVDGEYEFRSYRMDVRNDGFGIDLSTVQISMGRRGKVRLFPNVKPSIQAEEKQRIESETTVPY